MKSTYATAYRRRHHRAGHISLACEFFRDGSLDVDLVTARVTRNRKRLKQAKNAKGYRYIQLGKRRSPKKRRRENAWVHRLVKMKAIAVGMGGRDWRRYVRDIGHRLDVNHIDLVRSNNCADNLELMTEVANRLRRSMTEAELEFCRGDWV